MPLWLRKVLVVLITIFTLGYIQPSSILPTDASKTAQRSDRINHNKEEHEKEKVFSYEIHEKRTFSTWEDVIHTIPYGERNTAFVDFTVQQALKQSSEKFGPRITEKIGDQFKEEILPQIESAVKELSNDIDDETYNYLVITDQPTSGYGEKIFHIYDGRTEEDLFRLHVRREHPPMEGHWFTFHYHKSDDKYTKHYPLGKLYWDKNTPPKWNMYS